MEDRVTVEFEDDGQDFLEWDLERDPDASEPTYTVIACRPLQGWVWEGTKVLADDIQAGDSLHLITPRGSDMRLVHRVASCNTTGEPGETGSDDSQHLGSDGNSSAMHSLDPAYKRGEEPRQKER